MIPPTLGGTTAGPVVRSCAPSAQTPGPPSGTPSSSLSGSASSASPSSSQSTARTRTSVRSSGLAVGGGGRFLSDSSACRTPPGSASRGTSPSQRGCEGWLGGGHFTVSVWQLAIIPSNHLSIVVIIIAMLAITLVILLIGNYVLVIND